MKPITMVITYNRILTEFGVNTVKKLPGNLEPLVCYKRAQNLRDQLIRAHFTVNERTPNATHI